MYLFLLLFNLFFIFPFVAFIFIDPYSVLLCYIVKGVILLIILVLDENGIK